MRSSLTVQTRSRPFPLKGVIDAATAASHVEIASSFVASDGESSNESGPAFGQTRYRRLGDADAVEFAVEGGASIAITGGSRESPGAASDSRRVAGERRWPGLVTGREYGDRGTGRHLNRRPTFGSLQLAGPPPPGSFRIHEGAPPGLGESGMLRIPGVVHVLGKADRDGPLTHVPHERSEENRLVDRDECVLACIRDHAEGERHRFAE